jgi:hypothetical protein
MYFPLVKAVTSPQSPPLALFLHSNQQIGAMDKIMLRAWWKKVITDKPQRLPSGSHAPPNGKIFEFRAVVIITA